MTARQPGTSGAVGDSVITEAKAIVEEASRRGITVRLLGSLGVRMHCPDVPELHDLLNRRVKDIDLVCPKTDRNRLRNFLEERGYEVDRRMLIAMEGTRYLFRHPALELDLDVFVGDLDFNHLVPVSGRLETHHISLTLEDLVLHKLQVIKPTAGDLKDLFALFDVHEIARGSDNDETIDAGYVSRVLATDWGFHHTAEENLDRLSALLPTFESDLGVSHLPNAAKERVAKRIDELRDAIDREPKTLRWKVRAKIGDRMQWWQDVDDPRDAY